MTATQFNIQSASFCSLTEFWWFCAEETKKSGSTKRVAKMKRQIIRKMLQMNQNERSKKKNHVNKNKKRITRWKVQISGESGDGLMVPMNYILINTWKRCWSIWGGLDQRGRKESSEDWPTTKYNLSQLRQTLARCTKTAILFCSIYLCNWWKRARNRVM